ncbi:MAG: MBL fold metallo-hydrolase [Candidatus Riflebacteria bacterium]|nr:MBL fold metallo-hydrolase [Candidatus Riflebacteria bacterium]
MARVKFYGVRGSISVCGAEFQKFGGNTTCVLLDGVKRTVILDAGTGIRELGKELVKDPHLGVDRPCFIVFSHFHWDHIQGLPFFAPAYDPRRTFTISVIGRKGIGKDFRNIFETQMQKEYFPVTLDGMGAKIDFLQTPEDYLVAENSFLKVIKHNHPGDAYSYRFQTSDNKTIVFCTDIEHGDRIDPQIVALAQNADLLIHEGQYTPEELQSHKGWGHSSWVQAVEVGKLAGVKRLVITHHDPDHNDAFLEDIEKQCQAIFPNTILAREKMEIIV